MGVEAPDVPWDFATTSQRRSGWVGNNYIEMLTGCVVASPDKA